MITWFNLLAYMDADIVIGKKCLNCDHPLGNDGDGLLYCAFCLESDEGETK